MISVSCESVVETSKPRIRNMWAEITRPKFERVGLRYAEPPDRGGMGVDRAPHAAGEGRAPAPDERSARGGQRDPVSAAQPVSMAHAAAGIPAALDGVTLPLRLVGRRAGISRQ